MRRLEEIKEELAIEYGWKDYAELFLGGATTDGFLNEFAKRYARECCIASLERASEFAEVHHSGSGHYEVDKESITKTDNIILL